MWGFAKLRWQLSILSYLEDAHSSQLLVTGVAWAPIPVFTSLKDTLTAAAFAEVISRSFSQRRCQSLGTALIQSITSGF